MFYVYHFFDRFFRALRLRSAVASRSNIPLRDKMTSQSVVFKHLSTFPPGKIVSRRVVFFARWWEGVLGVLIVELDVCH